MRGKLTDVRLFMREFRTTFESTGSIVPSGRPLARALVRYARATATSPAPRRILEVGPGTGAVTRQLVTTLRPEDRLDLVELNPRFCARLRELLADDPALAPHAGQIRLIEGEVRSVGEPAYDLLVSGLPHNNFPAKLARELLEAQRNLVKPGGTLSFFEYIALRKLKMVTTPQRVRQRLREVGIVLHEYLRAYEVACDRVVRNVPPAWVHHLRFGEAAAA